MPSVQIKDVPVDVHRMLRARAAREGKSLQEYLRAHLIEHAGQMTLEEVLARVETRTGGHVGLKFAADVLREERDSR